MNSNKLTYIISILLIAVIIGLLIWATNAGNNPQEHSASTSESESAATSDASSTPPAESSTDDSKSPEASDNSDASDVSAPDSEEAYAQRVGKKYSIDMSKYLKYVNPADDSEYLILVNKENLLASNYVPTDLTDCIHTRKDGRDIQKLRLYAAKALEAFLAEAAEYGVTDVTVTSAYRSYSYQNYLFNLYCDNEQAADPDASREAIEAKVLNYSLKAGMSEHQSGLCVDMHNLPSANTAFGDTAQAKWLAENAHRFGFILRFPANKTDITEIQYEPWHFRFVGRRAATEIYEDGLCLEEYISAHS